MKKTLSVLKPYLRWFIWGGTLFFLLNAFKDHWQEVVAVEVSPHGWLLLGIALVTTLLAHTWSGWVWTWILKALSQPLGGWQALQVYLVTNIAKYLPGNVWHFYGRIAAVSKAGGSLGVASLSVLLEPLLMAAAALLMALLGSGLGWMGTNHLYGGIQLIGLSAVLLGVHPWVINPVIRFLSRSQGTATNTQIHQYPLFPLLGEVGFLLLRGTGFLLTLMALMQVAPRLIPQLLSVFSFSWLLGLIIPGAPGGLGVFEATAIALLDQSFPTGIILSTVALFRAISIVAEVSAAGLAWLGGHYNYRG